MATNTSVCAICDLRHLTTSSTHWCPECEEALCVDCKEHHILSKASRGHHVIPISDYNSLPPCIASINIFCTYHNEKYTQYCVKHEVPICYKCIKEHGNCGGLTLLEDLAIDIKSSEVFRDMEQSLKDIMVNISLIRENRESNIKTIKGQKKQIIDDISCLKEQINLHLDKMQKDCTKELDKIEAECCKKIQSILSSLNDQDKEMIQCNTEFENMKTYASDIQAFLGMREIQKNIIKHEQCIHLIVQDKNIENIGLEFTTDIKIQDILTNVKKFGSIIVDSCHYEGIKIVRKKDRQAQIFVKDENKSNNNIELKFKRKIKSACFETKGCCVTDNCTYLFTDHTRYRNKLVAVNSYCEMQYTIELSHPFSAFDLACIDDNTVAVSTGQFYQTAGVVIIDLTNRKVKRFIKLPSAPYGITFDGKSLICCTGNGLCLISCTEFICTNIPDTSVSGESYITTQGDIIVYTAPSKNTVSYLHRRKQQVLEFKNDSLINPGGITVDDRGNVFVIGIDSKNILVISPDGKQYKQIQTKEYGLTEPTSICFDKKRKQLIITNRNSFAHLYDVSYV